MTHLAAFLGLDFSRTVTPDAIQGEASPIVRSVFETGRMFLSEYEDDVVALHCTADDVWIIEGASRVVIFEDGAITTRELPETDNVSVLGEGGFPIRKKFGKFTVRRNGDVVFVDDEEAKVSYYASLKHGKVMFHHETTKAAPKNPLPKDAVAYATKFAKALGESVNESGRVETFGPGFDIDDAVKRARGKSGNMLSDETSAQVARALMRASDMFAKTPQYKAVSKWVTTTLKKDKQLMAALKKDGFVVNESTTPDNSQETEDMTITQTTSAALKISENKIELIPASGEGDALIECELVNDSPSHLRAVTAQIEEQAADMGFDLTIEFDDDLDEDSDEYADALADATHEILEGISNLLGDNLGGATMVILRDVRAFDEALAEGDFDNAFLRAEIIAATIDEDLLEAVKRMSRGAIAKRMRSAKNQTPAEKMRNRKAAKKRKSGAFKAKAKKYRKRYKARPGSKRESTGDEGKQLTLDEMYSDETYKASFKGKAGADDSLRKAALGHFKGTAGTASLFGTLKAQGSQYVGGKLKESSDSELLKVLSVLVHEGFLAYEAGEGYSATAKLIEFTLDD